MVQAIVHIKEWAEKVICFLNSGQLSTVGAMQTMTGVREIQRGPYASLIGAECIVLMMVILLLNMLWAHIQLFNWIPKAVDTPLA